MRSLLICVFFSVTSIHHAYSWDGVVTGKIYKIDLENNGLRVVLENSPALCGNSVKWAYVNKTNNNYEGYLSTLLAAKLSDRTVIVYSTQSTNSYCEIGYLSLR